MRAARDQAAAIIWFCQNLCPNDQAALNAAGAGNRIRSTAVPTLGQAGIQFGSHRSTPVTDLAHAGVRALAACRDAVRDAA